MNNKSLNFLNILKKTKNSYKRMVLKKRDVQINKIYNKNNDIDRPQNFIMSPILYLELFENKEKVKISEVNKQYEPKKKNVFEINERNEKNDKFEFSNKSKHSKKNKKNKKSKKEKLEDLNDTLEMMKSSSDNDSLGIPESVNTSPISNKSFDFKNIEDGDEIKEISPNLSPSNNFKTPDNQNNVSSSSPLLLSPKGVEKGRDDESDKLSVKLKNLLENDNLDIKHNKHNKHSSSPSPKKFRVDRFKHLERNKAPTLKELERKGEISRQKILPNITNDNFDNQDEDMKREYLFKFSLLKKSYPLATIPEFTIHSDLNQMKKTYENSVRRLSLDSTVETFKTYLLGGFMFTEYVFGKWFGIEMEGFTQQQILNMNSYERLLIELGEKSYVPKAKQWPVEMRLVGLILMNAAFFVGTKIIMKKTGAGSFSNILSSLNKTPSSNDIRNTNKRKMKGPNVNLEK